MTVPQDYEININLNELIEQISILEKDSNLVFKGGICSHNLFYLAYHNCYDDKLITYTQIYINLFL